MALLIIGGCRKTNEHVYFTHKVLERISTLVEIKPVPHEICFVPVYVLSKDDSIAESNVLYLKDVYDTIYKEQYTDFTTFLFDALNQRIKLDTKAPFTHCYYAQHFQPNRTISSIYRNENMEGLVNRYVVNESGTYTLKRLSLSLNEINSISYFFFINQYIRQDDDYYVSTHFMQLSEALD